MVREAKAGSASGTGQWLACQSVRPWLPPHQLAGGADVLRTGLVACKTQAEAAAL